MYLRSNVLSRNGKVRVLHCEVFQTHLHIFFCAQKYCFMQNNNNLHCGSTIPAANTYFCSCFKFCCVAIVQVAMIILPLIHGNSLIRKLRSSEFKATQLKSSRAEIYCRSLGLWNLCSFHYIYFLICICTCLPAFLPSDEKQSVNNVIEATLDCKRVLWLPSCRIKTNYWA